MVLKNLSTNIGKEIIVLAKTGRNNSLAMRPVKVNADTIRFVPSLSKDTVNFSKNSEIAKTCIYEKVDFWEPCESMLLHNPEVYYVPKDYRGTGHIYVNKIVVDESQSKGTGTRTLQKILKESLADPNCQGRIRFHAMTIDIKRGSPVGFYFKLGFRSENPQINKKFEQWLSEGAPQNKRPLCLGADMYLPKENIEQCLNYPSTKNKQ